MLEAGFVLLSAAVLFWCHISIVPAAMACGDHRSVALRLRRRFMLGAAVWVTLVLALAWAGVLKRWDWRPPPLMLTLVAIAALGIAIARSPVGDRLARGLPLATLVGLQSFRFPLEMVMHRAAEQGVMPVQMSYSGLNYDIVTGVTAVAVALWLRFGQPPPAVVWGWNILGLALLLNIVTVAILSTPLFAAFGSAPERLNTFVTEAPFVLLPTVLVVAAWTGHLVIFRALRARAPRPRSA